MRRTFEVALPIVITIAVLALWMRSCSGPRMEVRAARLERNLALVGLRNPSRGEGEIQVVVRALPHDGGPPLVGSAKFGIHAGEEITLPVPVEGARGDETLSVEVEYPPR